MLEIDRKINKTNFLRRENGSSKMLRMTQIIKSVGGKKKNVTKDRLILFFKVISMVDINITSKGEASTRW